MEETNTLQPMSFGGLFSNTIALIRRTLSSAAIPAFLILLGLSLIQGFGSMLHFEGAMEATKLPGFREGASQEEVGAAQLKVLVSMVPMFLTILLSVLGIIFVQTMITIASWEAANDRPISFGELMDETVGRPFWMGVVQTILLAFFLTVLVTFIGIILFATGGEKGVATGSYIIMVVLLYPIIATVFRLHKIAIEHRGPWQGMIASIVLVNSNFLRVIAALVIPGAIFFLIAVLVGEMMGVNPWDMDTGGSDPKAQVARIRQMHESYTWGVVISNSTISSLFTLFISYLLTPLYIDSRARRGEFIPDEEYERG